MKNIIAGLTFLGLSATAGVVPLLAQPSQNNCQPLRDLVAVPEIKSQNGRLRAVVMLDDEERKLATGTACEPQHLRYFKGHSLDSNHPAAWPSDGEMLPGPTLRARVGDLVQIAFYNQINTQNFPVSLDLHETGKGPTSPDGCDVAIASRAHPTRPRADGSTPRTVQIYPQNPDGTPGDTMPNCLHGSSTANIHFHGTHTTPSTTGDNVLLYVRPAMRNQQGAITGPDYSKVLTQFQQIWDKCEAEGPPTKYDDLPQQWRSDQKALLQLYDKTAPYQGQPGTLPHNMQLWPANQMNLDDGVWPQISLGAYPYCFSLPKYDPPKAKMGQAPGTHWYHAHKHGSTALNVANGMAGAFIIEGAYDDALKKFYQRWGLNEQVLVVQQLETALSLMSAGVTGVGGIPFSVNGRVNPVVTMRPGEVQMWRIVNASSRTFIQFDGFAQHGAGGSTVEWRQIAQDGVQFSFENYERVGSVNRTFNMAGANRADLLVKAPTHEADYELQVVASVSDIPTGTAVPLLTVRVKSHGKKINPPMDFIRRKEDFPEFPEFLKDIRRRAYDKRVKVYNTNPGPGRKGVGKMPQHTINGKKFDGEHVSTQMVLDTIEEWTVINETVGIAHPFHIHINPFQITEVFQPSLNSECVDPTNPDTWKPCKKLTPPYVWWDTFAIPSAQNITLAQSVCTSLENCPADIQQYTTCTTGKSPPEANSCTVKIPGYFKMRTMFADFTGQFVDHCHILAHEDRGMMQLVEVIEQPKTRYSHH